MTQKKKMAIICSTDYVRYPLGGMMSFILDSLPYLKDDFDITLWGVIQAGEVPPKYLQVGDVSYKFEVFSNVKTKNKIIPNLLRVSASIWFKRKALIKENYDVLYIHGLPLSFPFFNKKTKVVNHIHGMTNPFSMTANRIARNLVSISLYEKYRNWVVKKSDLILLASDKKGHGEFSSKFPDFKDKIKYLPNFADTSIFSSMDKFKARKKLGIDENETILVNTGRVSLQKDPILLLQAYISFLKSFSQDSRLVIIGDGELKSVVEKMAKESGIEEKILITGTLAREEINLWLNASDLYVYTSHANGFPISLAESATCGLPIVTMDVIGVHDLVIDNHSGFLIQERNPTHIAEAIQSALKKKQIFSKNIANISEGYTPPVITGGIKKEILEILR